MPNADYERMPPIPKADDLAAGAMELSSNGGAIRYANGITGSPDLPALFSQATVDANNNVKLSGQVALIPGSNPPKLVEGGVAEQTERIFDNIESVLQGLGMTWKDVSRIAVYLTDIGAYKVFNEVYMLRLAELRYKPARELVQVAGLALGAQVEITVDGCLPKTSVV